MNCFEMWIISACCHLIGQKHEKLLGVNDIKTPISWLFYPLNSIYLFRYLYRFNESGDQANGPWTDDEHKLFVARHKEIGAEGQWGIFSKVRLGWSFTSYLTGFTKNQHCSVFGHYLRRFLDAWVTSVQIITGLCLWRLVLAIWLVFISYVSLVSLGNCWSKAYTRTPTMYECLMENSNLFPPKRLDLLNIILINLAQDSPEGTRRSGSGPKEST